ncbi:MAG: proprotein convertase P-domain-containing protein [Verrucomicrobia bacterium]|nr:proprotein convertase P-domain-containing protein [Verrucomicrobiota bacterium]
MHLLKRLAAAALLGTFSCTSTLVAQSASDFWESSETAPQRRAFGEGRVEPEKLRVTRLNTPILRQVLNRAPMEVLGQAIQEAEEISLPMPDGTFARFRFVESPIMELELAAKFPEIKTYRGEGIDDPAATIRFDLTPQGFHAQILSPRGAVYIDPQSDDDAEVHVTYYKRDYKRAADDFKCLIPENEVAPQPGAERETASRSGTVLRTYRLACAATGEYTVNRGGTVSSALSAIATAINRINQIFEAEIAVRLVLIANNDLVIYTNGSTDPYSNSDGFAMLTQNISTLNSVIGSANYDIGHVFSTGGGGVAYLSSVCTSFKGGGVTGSSSPFGDPFYVDYVAHEMGHQFGANHTFNSETLNCGGGNRESTTAYEPGSGSTIMAYAGICGASNNLQPNSDPYFHFASFDEIISFISTGGTCAATTSTGNTVPTVGAGSNFTIPKNTHFTLTATGSDANGDSLTYCWEQRDLGLPQNLSDADNGSSPLFRSFNPTSSPSRTFPKLSSILANTASFGEKLPAVGRTMKFRVTARDNRSGGGGVNTSDMQVVVDGVSGPFRVTSPNTAVAWSNVQTVVWDVAGSASSPVNCSLVNILLSTDGGNTFPTTLAANTPNDGSQSVALPSVSTSSARIKIQAVGNIFFDISNVNFSLSTYEGGVASVGVDSLGLIGESCVATNNAIDPGETVQVRLALKNFGQVNATNVSAILLADSGVISPSPGQNFGTLISGDPAVTRDYSFTANGVCGGTLPVRFEIRTNNVVSSIYTNTFTLGGVALATESRTNATFIFIPDGNASPYPSQIAVSGLSGTIEKVTVTLVGLSHTWPDDLDIVMVGPQSQKVMLMSDAGGGNTVNGLTLTFDDAAALSLPNSSVISSGTYKPSNFVGNDEPDFFPSGPSGPFGAELSVLADANPNGTWSLYIRDQFQQDTGSLSGGWRVNITTKVSSCCEGDLPAPVQTVSHSGNQLTLQWSASAGKSYGIQMKTNLNQLSWLTISNVTAAGSTASFLETIESQQRYYRILVLE